MVHSRKSKPVHESAETVERHGTVIFVPTFPIPVQEPHNDANELLRLFKRESIRESDEILFIYRR